MKPSIYLSIHSKYAKSEILRIFSFIGGCFRLISCYTSIVQENGTLV